MKQDNYVIFKGTKDGIAVQLHPDADFEVIKQQLEKKVEDAAKFFDGVKTSIVLKGRDLTEEQESQLLDIISEKCNMTITFVKSQNTEINQMAALLAQEIQPHNITKFHKGSIRSGQCLEFDGSVVLIGDVNPGGEIKAEGNIIILGQLKGMAHAGCKGMMDAFVTAIYMVPVQLRIADIITRFPEENKKGPKPPEYAYVEDGQIYVMPLS
ncbi:MAG: septum site-determining protein MinC [Epulopiscium sp.]|jgi:septum site-determining protein MinC|nr:septum site-determining protein MinC [Candidatus Epulonipiscium sp.]